MISGILPLDKPIGWTSHDVVARVRRVIGQRRVGHAGTLDPLASGVLVLLLGDATRLSQYVMDSAKVYCADVVLGATTVTDDSEAPLARWTNPEAISREVLERCLERYRGEIEQVPPAYAAIKQGGEKLYTLARKGVVIEVPPRRVTVHQLVLVDWTPPRARLLICCSAGTYIRSLGRDIGAELGVGGYLHALRRLASGGISVAGCWRLEALSDRASVCRALLPLDHGVMTWPALVLDPVGLHLVHSGRSMRVGQDVSGSVRLYDRSGHLVALGRGAGDGTIKPFRVFEGERDDNASHH